MGGSRKGILSSFGARNTSLAPRWTQKEALLVCYCVAVEVRVSIANDKLTRVESGRPAGGRD